MTENEIRINETTMWREWITVRGLEPITLQDIDDRLAELKQQVKVEPEVKVNFAELESIQYLNKMRELINLGDGININARLLILRRKIIDDVESLSKSKISA